MGSFYKKLLKPIFDIFVAVIGILLLSPLMLLIAVAIKLDSKGPVIFKQPRLGLNGVVFNIYKFRSMVSDQSHYGKISKVYADDPRITKVGKLIRKTSFDEIPQLFNIVRGEMSFIGPRPPLPHFPKGLSEYTAFELQRFQVKPGIGGLAQTRCREIHDWDINIPIDIEYVKNYGFIYDLRLFLISVSFFFKSDNVYRKD
jgi:lipopolysaccharide/colanic/teichoic acid biosynthesis glycosyltransferase